MTKDINTKQEGSRTNKRLTGIVVNNKMDNSLKVRVERKFSHPLYGKIIKKHTNYLVHTDVDVKIGEVVIIEETRPISKKISWKVVEVLKSKE